MITGVVLARNEEANIIGCLEAFRPLVEELILIDMESSDSTVALARPLVDRVLTHRLVANFDAARNIAINGAKYDWMWFCDADERPTSLIGKTVRDLVTSRGHEFEALSIPFKSYFAGKWIEHCGWWPGYTMPRVLKRGYFRFREQLHGGVQVDGREVRLTPDPRLGIDHYSYRSISHYYEKFNRYTSTEAEQLERAGRSWDWRRATQEMVRDLWLYYERNNGKADGVHGWILSWLAGQYRWASVAKLLDLKPADADCGGVPENLDEFLAEMQGELERLRKDRLTPLGIVWRTPIADASGYAEEGRCFTKALAEIDRPLLLEPIAWSDQSIELSPSSRALFKALAASRRPVHYIAITNCIPTLAEPVSGAVFNILRTTFETDRLPDGWLPRLNVFDEVWVISNDNYRAFVRSGFAPEKLRIVPSCVDVDVFSPEGPQLTLPVHCQNRFVFLAVFDWQLRKGWDILLRAYVREFSLKDNTSLLMKISRLHGYSMDVVRRQVESVLSEAHTTLGHRPDIVIWDEQLAASSMPALYRSADAFVLPTRGEGWGRPFMEAMACGLPVIGTGASGSDDFMTDDNSFRVSALPEPVSSIASSEINVYRGHRWYEPDESSLRSCMRDCLSQPSRRNAQKAKALEEVNSNFSISKARDALASNIQLIEQKFSQPKPGDDNATNVSVELQGEFLAGHSFSNINERLAEHLGSDAGISLSIAPRFPIPPEQLQPGKSEGFLQEMLQRKFLNGPQVVIRHAYPPDWTPVAHGKWVHIQPWEFGYLPKSWVEPLKSVDEIWVPSHYVRQVYERSGISANRIHVIPWGVDPMVYNINAVPRLLRTSKSFRFLFVGGTIVRKGFDVVLQAFLEEFGSQEDVSLVIKDIGVDTVYRYGNFRERILSEIKPSNPDIIYFDTEMSPGQLASLYTACDCLVAPYRGEGFGLPIIEAMACGVAPMVPRGGPSDDFVDESTGLLLDTTEVISSHPEELCGPPMELVVSVQTLRAAMRRAFQRKSHIVDAGRQAALKVKDTYTWQNTARLMATRIRQLADRAIKIPEPIIHDADDINTGLNLAAIIRGTSDGVALADCLARVAPFASRVYVVFDNDSASNAAVAREYGADCCYEQWTSAGILLSATFDDSIRCYFEIESSVLMTDTDWKNASTSMQCTNSETVTLPLVSGKQLVIRIINSSPQNAPLVIHFDKVFRPYLGKRADTFSSMLSYLEGLNGPEISIVETGCIRMANDWGAGQSTLIFDNYIDGRCGSFISIDINSTNCDFARHSCISTRTIVINASSVEYLRRLSMELPQSIDLLYLDSLDVDWSNPHSSALYHLQELCAAMPALKPGAMIVVDDHRSELGLPGKSLYIADFMKSLKSAKCVFEGYQIGWIL